MPLARRVKFIAVGCLLCSLAGVAVSMVWLAAERHRLTNDPLALTSADDVRAACAVLVDRSLTRGGSHIEARYKLKVSMLKLRDGWSGLDAAAAHAVLGDVYELIADRVTADGAQNRDDMLAVLSETRPAAGDDALARRYAQALAKHGIAAVAN